MDRTNMVSLLDIGPLLGLSESKIVELGTGYSEITEDWGPDTGQKHYVNMKNSSNSVKGYAFSMSPERDFLSDEVQEATNHLLKTFPTGTDCETFYYRFFKSDLTGKSGDCIKVPVTVCPSSVGGAGGDDLTATIQINGNGDVQLGTITIGETFTWAEKVESASVNTQKSK